MLSFSNCVYYPVRDISFCYKLIVLEVLHIKRREFKRFLCRQLFGTHSFRFTKCTVAGTFAHKILLKFTEFAIMLRQALCSEQKK